jgi:fumarate reductase flavoprotein subunit
VRKIHFDKTNKKSQSSIFYILLLVLAGACKISTDPMPDVVRYKPGLYTSSARGFIDDIKISVSFSEDKITNITIDKHNETIGRSRVAAAIKDIPNSILQKQTLEVDIVTGATFTSNAIIKAVEECIKKARDD